jgi:RNA polymerase sigma factor (sigma-70 family)
MKTARRTRVGARLTPDEKQACHDAIRLGDEPAAGRARNRLVEGNLALAYLLAAKYHAAFQGRIPLDDLRQEAALGLIDASLTFDPDLGEFPTFAGWHVRKRILAAGRRDRLIRVPHQHQLSQPYAWRKDGEARQAAVEVALRGEVFRESEHFSLGELEGRERLTPAERAEANDAAAWALGLIDRHLTPAQAAAVRARELEGLGFAEVAERIGQTRQGAHHSHKVGIARLREIVEQRGDAS